MTGLLADLEDLVDSLGEIQDILASLAYVFAAKQRILDSMNNARGD